MICGLAGALLLSKAEPQVFNTYNLTHSGSNQGPQVGCGQDTSYLVCHALHMAICTEKSKEEQGWSHNTTLRASFCKRILKEMSIWGKTPHAPQQTALKDDQLLFLLHKSEQANTRVLGHLPPPGTPWHRSFKEPLTSCPDR